MTKEELVRRVCKKLGITLSDMRQIVDCMIDEINDAVIKHETIDIINLFKIKVKATRPHYFMNMITKERYMGEPKYKIEFRMNDKVRETIKNQKVLWQDLEDYLDEDLKKTVFRRKEMNVKLKETLRKKNEQSRNNKEKKS